MKHIVRVISHWGLLAHIYVSMVGFTLALLFAITGLTLNHQDFGWSEPQIVKSTITLEDHLVRNPDQAAIEQCLQEKLGIRSRATDYHADPDQIQMTFAAPGTRTTVTVNRADGKGEVETEKRGLLGRLGDLHKGADTGKVWYWVIDIAAAMLIVSSLTGMITLLALRARRRMGFIVGVLGVLVIVWIYATWVP